MGKKNNSRSTKNVAKNTKEKEPKLSLSISLNDEIQKVEGDSVVELMEQIKLPDFAATPALIEFTQGKDVLTIRLDVGRVRRYLANEMNRDLLHDSWQTQLNSL